MTTVDGGHGHPVVYHRDSPFAYSCHSCRRCCYHKRIQVNPYEVACIARALGCTTTEVLARYTTHGGTSLAKRPDGSCVFLDSTGCFVHAERPLACRLYPLGRVALPDGRETFVEHAPHPDTEGVYGTSGTVGDFLASQGVQRYVDAAERYYTVLVALQRVPTPREGTSVGEEPSHAPDPVDFIDADRAVSRALGLDASQLDVERLLDAHLLLLERAARDLTGEAGDQAGPGYKLGPGGFPASSV